MIMAYKIMQKGDDGVLREVVIRGEAVRGSDFNPADVELKDFDETGIFRIYQDEFEKWKANFDQFQ